jgi:5-methylcytosine-specific restriction endonuclease McrA
LDEALEKRARRQGNIAAEVKSPHKRHVPEKLRAAIFERDQGHCAYRNPETGRRCESRHFLELDHIQPLALGGRTEAGNLRVLCRQHNRLMAERAGLPSGTG